ncbi:hypothetical protein DFH08DRAFT_352819 [Mycena albidolilacea]|uniref:Uncharacterized protein n=1 Tax=Mycena albidolilacea TaxID=1033008 RepID=A0AAD7EHY4_9AGAR|nr:hypothetical protein DFH08DRAFT_352819 [Mycena albidolilacea]
MEAMCKHILASKFFSPPVISMTNQPNAKVTFSFKGDRVALYGAAGPHGGNYTAQLDDGVTLNMTEKIPPSLLLSETPSPELIFFAAGLDAGEHNVTFISTSPEVFTVDYAVVDRDENPNLSATSSSSTVSPGTSSTVLPNTTGAPPSSAYSAPRQSSGLSEARPIGLIAGVAILVALLLIALGYIACLRRRRNRREEETPHSFNNFPPPHPTGVIPAPIEHTQTSQQPLLLVPQSQRTSWDAGSFDSAPPPYRSHPSTNYQTHSNQPTTTILSAPAPAEKLGRPLL